MLLLSSFLLCIISFSCYSFTLRPLLSNFGIRQKVNIFSYELQGAVTDRMLKVNKSSSINIEEISYDESLDGLFPIGFNETDGLEKAIPISPDYADMKPNDPRFLDMPWPDRASPIATAFARHLQWKRSLTDGERIRWQKWAVYQRLNRKDKFDFSLEDYVFQKLLFDIQSKLMSSVKSGNAAEITLWTALNQQYKQVEETQIRATMKSFYSALNRQNFDDLRSLWLPDDNTEITLPGYNKQNGHGSVESCLRKMVRASKPFGTIRGEVSSIVFYGFIAVVNSIETVEEGFALKSVKRRGGQLVPDTVKPKESKRVLATTVLRKFNRQWRLLTHHAVPFKTSAFTGNQVDFAEKRKKQRREKEREALREKSGSDSRKADGKSSGKPAATLADALRDALLEGTAGLRKDWDRPTVRGKDSSREAEREREKGLSDGQTVQIDEEQLLKMRKAGVDPRFVNALGLNNLFGGGGNTINSNSLLAKARDDLGIGADLVSSSAGYSVSKGTVQAVRALSKAGSITVEQKDVLLADIISKVTNDETSLVESAFELLVMKGGLERPLRLKDRRAMDEEGFEEFSQQCILLAQKFKSQKSIDDYFLDDDSDEDGLD